MMRALFSGVTGLRSHQTRMDVIGNNIANVNTVGFKKSTVTFKDLYSETISAASANSGTGAGSTGGVNPNQIGLGVAVNAITTVHTPGAAQYTGNSMDVAISGGGYFVVESPTGFKYTRSGNFGTDTAGNLVTADGYYVKVVDPIATSTTEYVYNGALTDDLFVANTAIGKPSSTVHTGNITADLSTVMGKNYKFEYFPTGGGNGYVSSITVKYRPSVPDATGFTVVPPAGSTIIETLDMKGIADAYLAVVPDGTPTGAKQIEFQANGDTVQMFVDGALVATSSPIPTTVDGDVVTVDFGGSIGAIYMQNNTSGNVGAAEVATAMQQLENLPDIPLEETGDWWLVDAADGTQVEQVTLASRTTGAAGTQIASGDIVFTSSNYGIVRLNLSRNMDSMAALSDELSAGTIAFDIKEEPFILYEGPPGTLVESSLKTLTIDFNRYTSVSIDTKGAVVAQLKNDEMVEVGGQQVQLYAGDKVVLGYIGLASFNNPAGLEKIADNLYEESANSGAATLQLPGSGNVGALAPSNLEMSNVDLSEEMVNMIITQRGFQANSRIITVTDTMLEELVNLKR